VPEAHGHVNDVCEVGTQAPGDGLSSQALGSRIWRSADHGGGL